MKRVVALVWKDLLVELRAREFLAAMLLFALVTIVTLNFAFDLQTEDREASGAGALWIAFLFAGMLGLGRAIAVERDRGTLEGLTLCPTPAGTLFLGKFVSNALFITVVQVVSLPVFAGLYDLPVLKPQLFAVMVVGTLGYAALGTLFSAVASSSRAREVLLPLLLFPISIPVVIAVVRATTLILEGNSSDAWRWFNLLAAFDLIFITLAYLVFDLVLED